MIFTNSNSNSKSSLTSTHANPHLCSNLQRPDWCEFNSNLTSRTMKFNPRRSDSDAPENLLSLSLTPLSAPPSPSLLPSTLAPNHAALWWTGHENSYIISGYRRPGGQTKAVLCRTTLGDRWVLLSLKVCRDPKYWVSSWQALLHPKQSNKHNSTSGGDFRKKKNSNNLECQCFLSAPRWRVARTGNGWPTPRASEGEPRLARWRFRSKHLSKVSREFRILE